MAYYAPLELRDADGKPTGKFHYTCSNSAGTYAIGYCSGVKACKTCSDAHAYPADPECPECNGRGLLEIDDACAGHDTPREACDHYDAYLADHVDWKEKKNEWPKEKCDAAGCDAEGHHHALMPGRWHDALFCAEHKTRDAVFAHLQVRHEKNEKGGDSKE